MNKDYFYNKYDEELTKINKELPKLDELSSSYSKQAYVLMLYAHFEGFVYRISRDFFNVLVNIHKTNTKLNAHYNFCISLFDKNLYGKEHNTKLWDKFIHLKKIFVNEKRNNLIDTNDNIGYEIFKYILFLTNICEYKQINDNFYNKTFQEKQANQTRNYIFYKDIINELLEKRNDIAHGNQKILEDNFITANKIEEMSECIKVVLRQNKEDLYDILENEKYILEN